MFNNTVRLSFTTPDGDDVFIDATPIKAVSYDRPLQQDFLLNFQVILRANFPYLLVLDDEPNTETGALGSIINGFKLPFKLPLNIGESQIEGATTLEMDSPGFAIVTLNGSDDGIIVNPTITNITNGTSVEIRRPLNGSQQFFLIDGLYQKMTDENGNSVMQFSDGDFVFLDEGENVLLYTAEQVIPNS